MCKYELKLGWYVDWLGCCVFYCYIVVFNVYMSIVMILIISKMRNVYNVGDGVRIEIIFLKGDCFWLFFIILV